MPKQLLIENFESILKKSQQMSKEIAAGSPKAVFVSMSKGFTRNIPDEKLIDNFRGSLKNILPKNFSVNFRRNPCIALMLSARNPR